jgi:hypothetical protein
LHKHVLLAWEKHFIDVVSEKARDAKAGWNHENVDDLFVPERDGKVFLL